MITEAIKFYKYYISSLLKKNCKFYPTCSIYVKNKIKKHGFKCKRKIVKRILKCHVFKKNKNRYDPPI